MPEKKRLIFLLIFLVFLLFVVNYNIINSFLIRSFESPFPYEFGIVERVIDGDTLVVNGESIRLLGINCPERGEKYYPEAKFFLESFVLNKTVKIQFGKEKYDKYKRILAYVFLDGKNMNLQIVKEGFANFYFPSGKDIYYSDFKNAWIECLKNQKNICKPSTDKCAECIELKELNYKTQNVLFYNSCPFECDLTDWKIKDEGRKNFVFPEFVLKPNNSISIKVANGTNTKEILFWTDQTYVWTEKGDSLFLRDKENNLVLWENY